MVDGGGRFNDTCTEINHFSTNRHLNDSARGVKLL